MPTARGAAGPDLAVEHYESASFWLASLGAPLAPRPALEGDLRCDVAIAGAGFTGLWTAYFLKQLQPSLDIVMLDANIAGYGASGRNGGWCAAELLHLESWLEHPATRTAAIALQRELFETVQRVGTITAHEGIDCHFAREGVVTLATSPAQFARLAASSAMMARAGFGADYVLLDRAGAARYVAGDHVVGGLYSPHCAAIQPARLARGLAQVLERSGVRIFERTPVQEIAPRSLIARSGSVTGEACILACEGYTPRIAGFERALAPIHSRMIVTAPLNDTQWRASGLARRICFGDSNRMVAYGQVTADRRIAFGARGDYHFASRIEDRIDRDDPNLRAARERLPKLVPGAGELEITHAWTGPLGVSRARRPFVFFDAAAGFGWAGGISVRALPHRVSPGTA